MSMLHGIEVDVIDMARKIGIISNGVLPIAPLPDSLFTLQDLARRSWASFEPPGKPTLNQIPPAGKVTVMFWQSPERMNMIGQDANRDCFKGPAFTHCTVGAP